MPILIRINHSYGTFRSSKCSQALVCLCCYPLALLFFKRLPGIGIGGSYKVFSNKRFFSFLLFQIRFRNNMKVQVESPLPLEQSMLKPSNLGGSLNLMCTIFAITYRIRQNSRARSIKSEKPIRELNFRKS